MTDRIYSEIYEFVYIFVTKSIHFSLCIPSPAFSIIPLTQPPLPASYPLLSLLSSPIGELLDLILYCNRTVHVQVGNALLPISESWSCLLHPPPPTHILHTPYSPILYYNRTVRVVDVGNTLLLISESFDSSPKITRIRYCLNVGLKASQDWSPAQCLSLNTFKNLDGSG